MENIYFYESYSNFISTIEPLIPYLEQGLCTKSVHSKISKCRHSILENITNFLFDQKSCELVNPSWSTYSVKCKDNSILSGSFYPTVTNIHEKPKAQLYTSYSEKFNKDNWHIIVQKENKDLILNTFSIDSLSDFINLNQTNHYIFIPVSFSPSYSKDKLFAGHATCLIIDNYENCVYLFDPNGHTNYFDDSFTYNYYHNGTNELESLFEKYFSDLSDFTGIKYNFIPVSQWNPRNIGLNKKFNGSQVDNGGNCVCISILFFHYLFLTKKSLRKCLEDLANLNNEQLIQLINDYSVGISQQIDLLLEKAKQEFKIQIEKEIRDEYSKTYNLNFNGPTKTSIENTIKNKVEELTNEYFNFDKNDDEDKDDEDKDDNNKNNNVDTNNNKNNDYDNNNNNDDNIMNIENYNSELFELIYNQNKKKNIDNGINPNINYNFNNKIKTNNDNNINPISIPNDNLELTELEQEYLKFFV